METPETIRTSLQAGEWVTSIDFKDAYFHIPIQSVQEVHAFSSPGSVLPVQSPTLWSIHSSHGVHSQTHGTSEGYKDPPVPRRLAGESLYPRHLSPAYSNPGHTLSGTRVAGEQGKVRTGPQTGLQLRRLTVRPERGQGQTNRRTLADLNVIADKLSRLGQTIQTEWSLHPDVLQDICHQIQQQTSKVCLTGPRPPGMGSGCTQPILGGPGPIRLPTGSHLGQSGGEATGLPGPCNRIILIAPGWPNMPWFWDLVAMSSQIPLCLPNIPNLVSQPFNQVLHRNLSNLNLYAWLLEPQQSRSKASLRQWQHELRLLKEDQPDLSMRQIGPFLQSGASVIRWTSGHHL